jgi:hypothetical protein
MKRTFDRHHCASRMTLRFTLLAVALLLAALVGQAAAARTPGNVTVHTTWSSRALYFSFQVDDPVVVGQEVNSLGRPWTDDAVGVYLDLKGAGGDALSRDCLRVVISAAGGASVQRGIGGVWHDEAQWFTPSVAGMIRYGYNVRGTINNATKTTQGYDIEIGLPWSLLGADLRPPGTLETMGVALVCYQQGQTKGMTCWPEGVGQHELGVPGEWGRLRLQPDTTASAPTTTALDCPTAVTDPMNDGVVEAKEWPEGNVLTFALQSGEPAAIVAARQPVSLVVAWYTLDPLGDMGETPMPHPAHQPLQPEGPWGGPDGNLYHSQQFTAMQEAGIDALALQVPVDPAARARLSGRLAAFSDALLGFDRAYTADLLADLPLVIPALDLTGTTGPVSREALQGALDDFYAAVPPQLRLQMPDAVGRFRYPVLLTGIANVGPPAVSDAPAFADLLPALAANGEGRWGTPLGWIVDAALPATVDGPAVLARCPLTVGSGVQAGDGPVNMMVVAPGEAGPDRDPLPRHGSTVYEDAWRRVLDDRPDVVLLRSWNDFAHGTEIAPSRQYGHLFADKTRMAIIGLSQESGFAVRLLRHDFPSVLQPRESYPIELLLKNGTLRNMVAADGYSVKYRIVQKGVTVLQGTATNKIALLELSPARVRFTLPTMIDTRHALPVGDYDLLLDVCLNPLVHVDISLFTKRLATMRLPFSVSETPTALPVVVADAPPILTAGGTGPMQVCVRNTTAGEWRRVSVSPLMVHWVAELAGQPGVSELPTSTLTCTANVPVGGVAIYAGRTPVAPMTPGVYRLVVEADPMVVAGAAGPRAALYTARVVVRARDLRAMLVDASVPRNIADDATVTTMPLVLRNVGASTWLPGETRVVYQWLNWAGVPIPGASGVQPLLETVPPEGGTGVRMSVDTPRGSGAFRCAFGLARMKEMGTWSGSPAGAATPLYTLAVRPNRFLPLDLSELYAAGNWAAQEDAATTAADFDGNGRSYPIEEMLPDAAFTTSGYQPGYAPVFSTAQPGAGAPPDPWGPAFRFPFATAGRTPVLRATGQRITLPALPATSLYLVAARSGPRANAYVIINYTQGSERFQLNVGNWLADPVEGDTLMWRTRRICTPTGDDWTQHAAAYVYRIPLDLTRTVQAITLPDAKDIGVFALTLELP